MSKITKVEGWPFPLINDAFRGGDKSFFEITEDVFYQMLNVLPPMRDEYTGSYTMFWCSETYDHDNDGCPIHTMYIEKINDEGSRYFARTARTDKRNSFYLADFYEQLNNE
jgi:hypothetical protein